MHLNPFALQDKTILITGASSGIGKQVAITLSEMGANVILSGRNHDRLAQVVNQIGREKAVPITGDLTSEAVIEEIIHKTPKLDGIVHAAGIMGLIPFKFIKPADLNNMMNINFTAPTLLTLGFLKKKKINNSASIVYITSINGSVVGSKANSMYAASKGALSGMIKGMAIDLAKSKIRVNEIAPGMIETEGAMDIENIVSAEAIEDDKKKYPLGSYGKPEDVAYACVYLLSDASSWVTGTKIVIDGGFTIQ